MASGLTHQGLGLLLPTSKGNSNIDDQRNDPRLRVVGTDDRIDDQRIDPPAPGLHGVNMVDDQRIDPPSLLGPVFERIKGVGSLRTNWAASAQAGHKDVDDQRIDPAPWFPCLQTFYNGGIRKRSLCFNICSLSFQHLNHHIDSSHPGRSPLIDTGWIRMSSVKLSISMRDHLRHSTITFTSHDNFKPRHFTQYTAHQRGDLEEFRIVDRMGFLSEDQVCCKGAMAKNIMHSMDALLNLSLHAPQSLSTSHPAHCCPLHRFLKRLCINSSFELSLSVNHRVPSFIE